MTSEQINIAIAESLGWTQVQLYITDPAKRLWGYTPGPDTDWTSVPDYCNDLNAMHEVEKTLDDEQWLDYIRCLQEDVCRCFGKYRSMIAVCHATALQRAEAYLRTIGKWNEKD